MSIELKTKYGQIDISIDVIATIAGGAAVDCYGIVGMASKNQIKRWNFRNFTKRKFF